MPLPLSTFIGLRYVRARSGQFFVSFISWVSMLGICLGVATLIVILSVMNGFENELRGRLLSLASHATLTGSAEALADWRTLASKAVSVPGVVGAAPYVEQQVLVANDAELSAAVLRGIDPVAERGVSDIGRSMKVGSLEDLVPGSDHIVLGRVLAYQLAVSVGDPVTVLVPASTESGEIQPRIREFRVSGIFEVGITDHDSVLALAHLQDAAAMTPQGQGITGLRLKFDDIFAAPVLSPRVAQALGGGLRSSDWTVENASYFRAIRIEKTMMAIILLLVVTVAAFNIVAALVMVVTGKRTDIAILRTLGLAPRSVVNVFLTHGVVIGWLGVVLGVVVGLSVAFNVGPILGVLDRVFGFQLWDADVYYITQTPSDVQAPDVVLIAVLAFALTLLATVYPSLRAARTPPAEALRYE
jgi:lipoprotein-releasing system permease protein